MKILCLCWIFVLVIDLIYSKSIDENKSPVIYKEAYYDGNNSTDHKNEDHYYGNDKKSNNRYSYHDGHKREDNHGAKCNLRDQYDDGYKRRDNPYTNGLENKDRNYTDKFKHGAEHQARSATAKYQKPHPSISKDHKALSYGKKLLSPNEHDSNGVHKRSLFSNIFINVGYGSGKDGLLCGKNVKVFKGLFYENDSDCGSDSDSNDVPAWVSDFNGAPYTGSYSNDRPDSDSNDSDSDSNDHDSDSNDSPDSESNDRKYSIRKLIHLLSQHDSDVKHHDSDIE